MSYQENEKISLNIEAYNAILYFAKQASCLWKIHNITAPETIINAQQAITDYEQRVSIYNEVLLKQKSIFKKIFYKPPHKPVKPNIDNAKKIIKDIRKMDDLISNIQHDCTLQIESIISIIENEIDFQKKRERIRDI